MVIIGVDSHKRTHTFVAVDEAGRKLTEKTLTATTEGHLDALAWSERWPERRWAIEDCRHLTRRLESDLLVGGEEVARVPTRLMAGERRGGRERGKSDPIDALAVARAALREPDLPVARLDGVARELKLLVDHREDLLRERVRIQARLRWHLHELFPGLVVPSRGLRRTKVFDELDERLVDLDGTVARIARELVARLRDLTVRVNELEREITVIVRRVAPTLLLLQGCAALSAAKIVGETAGVRRFRSKAAFARWNGTAPIPVWERKHQLPAQPRRKPTGQRRSPPNRRDTSPPVRRRADLPRFPHGEGRQHDRSCPPAPPPPLRRGLPPTARRRSNRAVRTDARSRGLT